MTAKRKKTLTHVQELDFVVIELEIVMKDIRDKHSRHPDIQTAHRLMRSALPLLSEASLYIAMYEEKCDATTN